MSRATFTGYDALRLKLAEIEERLRAAAGGDVVNRAAAKVSRQIDAVSKRFLGAHIGKTGNALAKASTTTSGGTVVHDRGVEYARFIPGNPFGKGSFPPFVLKYAAKVFAAELEAKLSGKPSPAEQEAEAIVAREAAKSARVAAAFKRAVRAVYRKSDEFKAKRKAERAAYKKTDEYKANLAARRAKRAQGGSQ